MKKFKIYNVFIIILFSIITTLGIGYAQISNINLTISGEANLIGQPGVFINNASYSSGNNIDSSLSNINTFYGTMLNTKVVLNDNYDSSITYEVTIQNTSDTIKQFKGVEYDEAFYDNEDIIYELNNINIGDLLSPNDSVTCTITFKHKENQSSYTNNVLNSYLNFKFEDPLYTITYVNFTGDISGLASSIPLTGGTIVFNETTGIPSDVTVIGADYDYSSSPNLVLSNVVGNVTITAINSAHGTWDEPLINNTNTSYEPNDVPAGETIQFDNAPGKPKIRKDEDGNVTDFTFTDVGSSGLDITTSGGVDTGVIPLDGKGFVIDLVATFNVVKNGVNSGKYFLSALEPTATGATTYKGFAFAVTKSNARIGLYGSSSASVSSSSSGATWGQRVQQTGNLTTGDISHTIHVEYTPGTSDTDFGTLTWSVDGNSYTYSDSSIPATLANATITIGTLGVEHTRDMGSMVVTSFQISKTD